MFPKNKRISKEEFNFVFKNSKTIFSESFLLKYLSLSENKISKFAVSAPIKIFKKSVERNKVRRRAFGILKDCEKNLIKNLVIILIANESFLIRKSEDLKSEISECFRKINESA